MVIGEDPYFLVLTRIERDHGTATHAQELLDRHFGPSQQYSYLNLDCADLTQYSLQDLPFGIRTTMFARYGFSSVKTRHNDQTPDRMGRFARPCALSRRRRLHGGACCSDCGRASGRAGLALGTPAALHRGDELKAGRPALSGPFPGL